MRELTYRDIIIRDFSALNRWKFALMQQQEELETIDLEFSAIKATNYDKMPTGSGENTQEEKLVTAIAKKDALLANLEFNRRRVADLERLLDQLPDDERLVIERTVINGEKYATDALAEELGYERTQIWRIKNKALAHLCQLRHGAAYQP